MCTGLEPLVVSLFGTAAGTAATTGIAAGLGAAGAGLAAGALQKKPQMPAIPDPVKPPQAARAPERAALLAGNASRMTGLGAGNAGTFLTGPGGISPTSLNLGRNTLLGQ